MMKPCDHVGLELGTDTICPKCGKSIREIFPKGIDFGNMVVSEERWTSSTYKPKEKEKDEGSIE